MQTRKINRREIDRDNAKYAALVTAAFKEIKRRPKTHVIQMHKEGGEVIVLTKPDSYETTKNTLRKYKRFMSGVEMVEVQKGKKK